MSGFWTKTELGHTIHINGDPNMSEETRLAITRLADAYAKLREMQEKAFEHVWGQDNNDGIDKDIAREWFLVGVDWQEEQAKKRIEYQERRSREEIEFGRQQSARIAVLEAEVQRLRGMVYLAHDTECACEICVAMPHEPIICCICGQPIEGDDLDSRFWLHKKDCNFNETGSCVCDLECHDTCYDGHEHEYAPLYDDEDEDQP